MDEPTPNRELPEGTAAAPMEAVDSGEAPTVYERVTAGGTGPGSSLRSGQPLWTAFLTPIAVIIGAAIIAGAVWYSRDNWASGGAGAAMASANPTLVAVATPAVPTATPVPTASPVPTPAPPTSAAFEAFASQLGLDLPKFQACVKDPAITSAVDAQQQVGIAAGVGGTPTFFINNKRLVGAMPWTIMNEVIQAELKGSPTTLDGYSDTIKQLAANSPPYFEILKEAPKVEGMAVDGSPGAKVKIIEFSDFQCPYCKRWIDETYASLKPLLGADVSLSFAQFPLTQIHPNAPGAAVAAECAGAQDKFWEMHDLLFANQGAWSSLTPS